MGGKAMRPIKFRAKDKSGEWRYGLLSRAIVRDEDREWLEWVIAVPEERFICFVGDENTIGQFTGLRDKNGKEIYEGDLLFVKDESYGVSGIVEVFWHDQLASYLTRFVDTGDVNFLHDWLLGSSEAEVIGNIHDERKKKKRRLTTAKE